MFKGVLAVRSATGQLVNVMVVVVTPDAPDRLHHHNMVCVCGGGGGVHAFVRCTIVVVCRKW